MIIRYRASVSVENKLLIKKITINHKITQFKFYKNNNDILYKKLHNLIARQIFSHTYSLIAKKRYMPFMFIYRLLVATWV